MQASQIVMRPIGPPELHRADGWFYRLHGVHFGEWVSYGSLDVDQVKVIVRDLSDKTLDSIRVLRDNLEAEIELVHETY